VRVRGGAVVLAVREARAVAHWATRVETLECGRLAASVPAGGRPLTPLPSGSSFPRDERSRPLQHSRAP
jgi:hypothetical protein